MSKKPKKRQVQKSDPLIRLSNTELKNTIKNGNEDSLPEKYILSKLFTPEVKVVTELSEEEKSLMKDSNSDTLVEFIISTDGLDRDGDTIAVEGWNLANFHKNPVVPWAHDYGQPPVARAINTRIEDGSLKSKAMFTSKDLYPFGDMIGKMYTQKFLNAVSVGFDPTKFVYVDDSERKFGIDFLEQELLEYSAVPVPSNPQALIQARSKGIDIAPMKEYLEILMNTEANRKGLDMDVMDNLIKVLNNNSTTTVGKSSHEDEDDTYEIDDDVLPKASSTSKDSDKSSGDTKSTDKDDSKNIDSLGSSQTKDADKFEEATLKVCTKYCKALLSDDITEITELSKSECYSRLEDTLKHMHGIEIFDFKYVDASVLKNFPERYSFDDATCTLTEKTQKEIEDEVVVRNEVYIMKALENIRKIVPEYSYREMEKEKVLEFDEDLLEKKDVDDSTDKGDSENVLTVDDMESTEDLRKFLKTCTKRSIQTTFDKVTGKLD